jgi:hypothetical protein
MIEFTIVNYFTRRKPSHLRRHFSSTNLNKIGGAKRGGKGRGRRIRRRRGASREEWSSATAAHPAAGNIANSSSAMTVHEDGGGGLLQLEEVASSVYATHLQVKLFSLKALSKFAAIIIIYLFI